MVNVSITMSLKGKKCSSSRKLLFLYYYSSSYYWRARAIVASCCLLSLPLSQSVLSHPCETLLESCCLTLKVGNIKLLATTFPLENQEEGQDEGLLKRENT